MSWAALEWAAQVQAEIDATGRAVLSQLALHADQEGVCWPGTERIATHLRTSPRTVRRRLDELEALGLLTRERRRGSGGRLGTYLYRLRVGSSGQPCPVDQWTPVSSGEKPTLDIRSKAVTSDLVVTSMCSKETDDVHRTAVSTGQPCPVDQWTPVSSQNPVSVSNGLSINAGARTSEPPSAPPEDQTRSRQDPPREASGPAAIVDELAEALGPGSVSLLHRLADLDGWTHDAARRLARRYLGELGARYFPSGTSEEDRALLLREALEDYADKSQRWKAPSFGAFLREAIRLSASSASDTYGRRRGAAEGKRGSSREEDPAARRERERRDALMAGEQLEQVVQFGGGESIEEFVQGFTLRR